MMREAWFPPPIGKGKKVFKKNHAEPLTLDAPHLWVHMDERGEVEGVGGSLQGIPTSEATE